MKTKNKKRFRIVENDHGFYPQVKCFFKWKRIGRHVSGFGLYQNLNHPESYNETTVTIADYQSWLEKSNKVKKVYEL